MKTWDEGGILIRFSNEQSFYAHCTGDKKSKGILIRFPNEPSFQTPTRQNDQVIQLEYYKINTFVRLKPLPT